LLGDFTVSIDGTPPCTHCWNRRHAAALVKILALAPGRQLHREKVMDLLWPDDSPRVSAPRLHKAAHYARRAAGSDETIVLRNDVVQLFPNSTVIVDVVEFERLAKQAVADEDALLARRALAWYGGELLPGDQYDDWAYDRRTLLHLRRLDLLRVAGEWRDLAEAAPTDERAHVQLMQMHIDAGDGRAALEQYDHLERMLERELGVEPGGEARHARLAATALDPSDDEAGTPAHVAAVLAELSRLAVRQSELLAELASVRESPRVLAS
jgi:DNA-binding SARP family transcriptional activator